ncbi:uncharacterized protein LOC142181743 [Nicotiana tabacum]|uniref:Uncharacterized protein LOC142181743 n=1 Tax=Nicotiana tabacum TaxID=4097 RepID=A0AC58UPB3_TOBAC
MAGRCTSDLRDRVQRLEALIGVTDDPLDLADLITEIYHLKYGMDPFREGQGSEEHSEVKIPDPKAFGGARSAKELENFLWDMEQYFVAAKVPDRKKVKITSMYLTGDAKLWWRTRMADDESAGRPKIDTWNKIRKEMKDQFLPKNASWLARDRLKRLRQTRSICDYIKEFTSLMLDIQNMLEDNKLHNFISGMQAWAQNKLRRQKMKDLPSAIAAADSLVDYRKNNWDGEGQEVVVALVNPLQLLNVISLVNATSNETYPHSLLMHVEMRIGDKGVIAMVDTGATHTFVSASLVHKYRLSVSKYPSYMKTVNAKAQAIVGMAYNIPMSVGNWKGKVNLMKHRFVPVPHLDGMLIMNETAPGFVKIVHPYGKEETQWRASLVSAMTVEKGLKRGDDTFLPAMVEVKPDVKVEVMDCVAPILTLKELAELQKQLNELLDAGLIQPSKALFGAPVLFQKKQDETLQMCVDYRALNKVTVKNKYPVPLVQDLMDRLSKACWFTKLYLRFGYWQVQIAEGDESKTTCVTRYGSYEFLVMPFGLTNAPATFCNLMNDVLYEYLDDFFVVYLDTIVIYSQTLDEHMTHLIKVLSRLREYQLYVKMEKCKFARQEIKFLGHLVS